jgi:hypothetical protein
MAQSRRVTNKRRTSTIDAASGGRATHCSRRSKQRACTLVADGGCAGGDAIVMAAAWRRRALSTHRWLFWNSSEKTRDHSLETGRFYIAAGQDQSARSMLSVARPIVLSQATGPEMLFIYRLHGSGAAILGQTFLTDARGGIGCATRAGVSAAPTVEAGRAKSLQPRRSATAAVVQAS